MFTENSKFRATILFSLNFTEDIIFYSLLLGIAVVRVRWHLHINNRKHILLFTSVVFIVSAQPLWQMESVIFWAHIKRKSMKLWKR